MLSRISLISKQSKRNLLLKSNTQNPFQSFPLLLNKSRRFISNELTEEIQEGKQTQQKLEVQAKPSQPKKERKVQQSTSSSELEDEAELVRPPKRLNREKAQADLSRESESEVEQQTEPVNEEELAKFEQEMEEEFKVYEEDYKQIEAEWDQINAPFNSQEFMKSKTYQLQKEIVELIKSKIGTKDQPKINHFYAKLKELQAETNIYIEDYTMKQIDQLLKKKQELDDAKIQELLQKSNPEVELNPAEQSEPISQTYLMRNEYFPTVDADTTKDKPIPFEEYEDFLSSLYLEEVQAQDPEAPDLLESNVNQYMSQEPLQEEEVEEFDEYQEQIEQFKLQKQESLIEDEDDVSKMFQFDRPSQDLPQFAENAALKQLNELKERGLFYPEGAEEQVINPRIDEVEQTEDLEMEEYITELTEISNDFEKDARTELKGEYDQMKSLVRMTNLLRSKLHAQMKQARNQYLITLKQKERLEQQLFNQAKEITHQHPPIKIFDFVKQERKLRTKKLEAGIQNRSKYFLLKCLDFGPNTTRIEDINNEFSVLNEMYQSTDEKDKKKLIRKMYQTVFKVLNDNKITPNQMTYAKFFEYGVLVKNHDFANQNLTKIIKSNEPLVQANILKEFFGQCLRTDNFNGLGYLTAYVQKFNIDVTAWKIQKFKSALDFYLNARFNLNNILIFTKFYTVYHRQHQEKGIKEALKVKKQYEKLGAFDKQSLRKRIFQHDTLVDMRALFGHLVQKVGNKDALDPISKEDSLWKLVDFLTNPVNLDTQKYAENNYSSLNPRDVALYFKNHFDGSKTFERVTQLVLRYRDDETFQNAIIQHLKEYQAQRSALPFSFDQVSIRNSYLKLKSLRKQQNVTFNDKALEYFLYLFKSSSMWPEIIDLCENFDHLNGKVNPKNDIKNYYLSDALLKIPSKQHYHKLVSAAVYDNKEEVSAGYTTALTKAYFKDGSIDHAISFFQGQIGKIREVKEKREEFLIKLFDSVYGEHKGKEQLTYQEFKKKYLKVIELGQRCLKETYTVQALEQILEEKDYDQMQVLFQLYMVQKEETTILSQLERKAPKLAVSVSELPIEELTQLPEHLRTKLQDLRARKYELAQALNPDDVETLEHLQDVMKDDKLNVLNKVDSNSRQQLSQVFSSLSKEQVEEMFARSEDLQRAAEELEVQDEASEVLKNFNDEVGEAIEDVLSQGIDEMFHMREVPDKNTNYLLEAAATRKRGIGEEMASQNEYELQTYYEYMRERSKDDEMDPITIASEIHEEAMGELQEELWKALNTRRSEALDVALKIFNKVQDQALKIQRLNDVTEFEQIDEEKFEIDKQEINESLDKFDKLLNDPRSPLFTALKTMGLVHENDIISYNDLYLGIEDLLSNPIDLEHLRNQRDQLEILNEEVETANKVLKNINSMLMSESNKLNESTQAKEDKKQISGLERQLESRIQQLYEEYKKSGAELNNQNISRDEKLSLMRDVLALEYCGSFASTDYLFPAFYSQDLIIFGLENNIPEAIRLGEHMLSSNGQTVSPGLAMAVKNYMLYNSEKYNQAIRKTGPIDNSSIYRKTRGQEQPTIMSMDDPYWVDFLQRNVQKRTTSWKIPSFYAWDHKQYGIYEDIFGTKTLQDMQKRVQKYGAFI